MTENERTMAILEGNCGRCSAGLKVTKVCGLPEFVENNRMTDPDTVYKEWGYIPRYPARGRIERHCADRGRIEYKCPECGATFEAYQTCGHDWVVV